MVRIKEIKISIHRKYTKDFNSYGYRIGIMLDVDKDDPRSGYYEGKAFLNERIKEEDLVIKNAMDKRVAEKESGYKELGVIPKKRASIVPVKDIDLGGFTDVSFEKERGVIEKIMGETGLTWDDVVNLAREKGVELKGLINEKGAIYIVGKELGVGVGGVFKEVGGSVGDDGDKWIPFDVRAIRGTTSKAVLVELFGDKGDMMDVWIPKSCVKDGGGVDKMMKGEKTMLFVKDWFLKKQGLL